MVSVNTGVKSNDLPSNTLLHRRTHTDRYGESRIKGQSPSGAEKDSWLGMRKTGGSEMKDEVLTIIEPSVNGSEPRVLRFEDGKVVDKGACIEALRKAELQRDELLEENKEWSSLIGQVYERLKHGDPKGALELIRNENIVTLKDDKPFATSRVGVLRHKSEEVR